MVKEYKLTHKGKEWKHFADTDLSSETLPLKNLEWQQ